MSNHNESADSTRRQGFIERVTLSVRNFMIGALAVEGAANVIVPFVDTPASIIGGEVLAAMGSELIAQSEERKRTPAHR
jgi:hypothetical protein